MKDLMYEDQLPQSMTDAEYDAWYDQSEVVEGVRMGPRVEMSDLEEYYHTEMNPGGKWDGLIPDFKDLGDDDIKMIRNSFHFMGWVISKEKTKIKKALSNLIVKYILGP